MSLGKLLYEANGKQTALRILDANGSLESSGNDNGKFKDPDLKCANYWTVKTVIEFDGTEIGKGNGLMFVDDGEIVFYVASFTGSPSHSGRSIRGSIDFQTGTIGSIITTRVDELYLL